jgi:hypothetical protein
MRLPHPARAPRPAAPVVALVVALLTLALACADRDAASADSAAPPPEPVASTDACTLGPAEVDSGGVGGVRLGMTAAEVERTCPSADTAVTFGEGILEPALVVTVGSARAIAVVGDDNRVTRIVVPVRGPTANGVGVGSRIGALRRLHGRVCGMVGEGRIVVVADRLPGVSFATSLDYARWATDDAALADGALPDTARLTSLWVHGETVPCGAR